MARALIDHYGAFRSLESACIAYPISVSDPDGHRLKITTSHA